MGADQPGAPDDQPAAAVNGLGDLRLTIVGVVHALPGVLVDRGDRSVDGLDHPHPIEYRQPAFSRRSKTFVFQTPSRAAPPPRHRVTAPAEVLRSGNAGSNTASDHIAVLDLALEQLDETALDGEILVRADGAGATHALTVYCREARTRFSVGFDLTEDVREAITSVPEPAWQRAIRADGSERGRSQVAEISDRLDRSSWPQARG